PRPAAALIRDTVPSPLLATHTSPPVTVRAAGSVPTGICCTTAWVTGLIRDTVPAVRPTAQTEPAPNARLSGLPTATAAPARPPAASIRPTLLPGKPAGPPAAGRPGDPRAGEGTGAPAGAAPAGAGRSPFQSSAWSWASTEACSRR